MLPMMPRLCCLLPAPHASWEKLEHALAGTALSVVLVLLRLSFWPRAVMPIDGLRLRVAVLQGAEVAAS